MRAVAIGDQKSFEILLKRKPDLEAKNSQGDTALVMAIANDQDQLALQLIQAGADIKVLGGIEKNNLVYMAASVNAKKTLQELVKRAPEQINVQNKKGDTALHVAAKYGTDEIIRILLKAGAKKDIRNNENKKPLDLAKEIQNDAAIKLLK